MIIVILPPERLGPTLLRLPRLLLESAKKNHDFYSQRLSTHDHLQEKKTL